MAEARLASARAWQPDRQFPAAQSRNAALAAAEGSAQRPPEHSAEDDSPLFAADGAPVPGALARRVQRQRNEIRRLTAAAPDEPPPSLLHMRQSPSQLLP